MAVCIIATFPGGTAEQYEATSAEIHPVDGLPPGQLAHVAGPAEGGWQVVAVWDSIEAYQRFGQEVIGPAMGKLAGAGLPGPPQTEQFDVHSHVTA